MNLSSGGGEERWGASGRISHMRTPRHTPALATLLGLSLTITSGLSVGATPLRAQDHGRDHGQDRAQEVVAREAVAAAAERYTRFSSLCADFDQTLFAGVLGRDTRSAGRLCQKRPNLFEMDFSEPAGDRIVVDGEHVWVWYRSINPETVIRIPLDPTRGGSFDFYREFLSDPLEKYDISGGSTEEIDGVSTVRVDLVPREPRGYVGALVWIDPDTDLIRRISIEEENGNVRTVTLRDVQLDSTIPDGTFRFEVPEGVSVANPRGGLR